MASFKYLIFIALAVYETTASAPILSYSYSTGIPAGIVPGAYPYAQPAYPGYVAAPAEDDGSYWPGKYDKNELPAAPLAYAPLAYAHYGGEDDGSYWPGKYDKNELPAAPLAYAHHGGEDDGSYWPGKYEKPAYAPAAYKAPAVYPIPYRHY